jgi:hypothetical protein
MICLSLSTIKVRGTMGDIRKIPPGEIFYPCYPEKIQPLVEAGRVRIIDSTKPISEERKKTLNVVMGATILHFRDELLRGGKWKPSPETHVAELEIERLQHEILEGRGKLIDFREACERWQKVGTI